MIEAFFEKIGQKLIEVQQEEQHSMEKAAYHISQSIQQGGMIYLFGCGHSHLLGSEVFYRAGGLVPIYPIFVEELMLHKGASRSSQLEKQNGYAEQFMHSYEIQPVDVVIVISNSGINPVPVDVALIAKEKGATVIGLTSLTHSKQMASRHHSNIRLFEAVDIVLNNHVDMGDAMIEHKQISVKFGPSSTIIGACILQAVLAKAIEYMIEDGFEPPIFQSGNLPNTAEHNQNLVNLYKKKFPKLPL